MQKENTLIRYSVIPEKNSREIVMLRGTGCKWRKCLFCDYHLDFSKDVAANYTINKEALSLVTGQFHQLEVINSGSFVDLDKKTMGLIEKTCLEKCIHTLYFECHWQHRTELSKYRDYYKAKGIHLKIKTGVETFDPIFRERYLKKGMDGVLPKEIAHYFDEVCLLQGLPGQSAMSMQQDIETGLAYFERVCVNIMNKNKTPIQPDPLVIELFYKELYPKYQENPRIDILLNNTDFGVGRSIYDE